MDTKAVIFDLDGTLLDSLDDIADSANSVLQKRGFPTHSADDYRYFVGNGVQILIERIVPVEHQHDEPFVSALVNEMLETYRMNWKNRSRLYDGIPEMLQQLLEKGISIAVLSNKPQASTQRCVDHFLADYPFVESFGQSTARPAKPDPAGAFELAECMSMKPSECVFVGDTATDMETAVAAGMYPIGVLWGFRPEQELADAGAQAIIQHPSELIGQLP